MQITSKRAHINTRHPQSRQAPLLVAGFAALLAAAVGWAALPAPSPEAFEPVASSAAADEAGESRPLSNARCDECGEIASVRHVASAGNLPATYEITVRMRDGSLHVTRDPTPADWRAGDRIKYIDGATPAGK